MSIEFELIKQQIVDEAVKQKHERRVAALRGAVLALQMTQQYNLSKDTWTCTETRILHEIDADGESKQIVTCVEYRRK